MKVIIIEDEKKAASLLESMLLDIDPDIEIADKCYDLPSGIKSIRKYQPDLVFLDVNMPGLDGMGVVRQLRLKGVELPHVIFVTAYDQYAVEAFRLEALDYLLKPVDKLRLAESVERARCGWMVTGMPGR